MSGTESHPLMHWLDSMALATPDSPALYIENEEINYQTLKAQVDALVSTLSQSGIKSGDNLALVTASSRILALMAYAAPHMGITFLPLDPRMPAKWLNAILEQARTDHVLCDNDINNQWASDVNVITIGQLLLQQFSFSSVQTEAITATYTPLMLATSGSTDLPKVVLLSPENISASVETTISQLDLNKNNIWLNCLPLFHIAGLMILYRSIASGANVILHEKFNPEKVIDDINQYAVSHISLTPTMLVKLIDASKELNAPASLETVFIGGAPLEPSLAQRALKSGWPLYLTYGMTETSSQIASAALQGQHIDSHPLPVTPYDNVEVQIRDERGQPCNGSGHIALRGPQIMVGYANADNIQNQGIDEQGWLLTNDMGEVDPNGNLVVMGRADEIIISGGEKIHPHQVEILMKLCPGINDVAIIPQPDNTWGNILMAIYAGDFNEQEVEEWCQNEFEGVWKPRMFRRLDEIPLLANGKLDKKALNLIH